MITKRCSTCKEEKDTGDFYKNRARPDGLQQECKACTRERSKTLEGRNKPSNRKRWADQTYKNLRLTDEDY